MPSNRAYTGHAACHHNVARMTGVGMLEVLIALLILSVGVLGLAQLQGVATKQNYNGYLRSQATFLAASILERMRSNTSNASDYIILMDADRFGTSNRADSDVTNWLETLAATLPAGDGQITKNDNTYTVTVQYGFAVRHDNNDDDAKSTDTIQISLAAEIGS